LGFGLICGKRTQCNVRTHLGVSGESERLAELPFSALYFLGEWLSPQRCEC